MRGTPYADAAQVAQVAAGLSQLDSRLGQAFSVYMTCGAASGLSQEQVSGALSMASSGLYEQENLLDEGREGLPQLEAA